MTAKSAVIGEYIICKEANGSIIVYKKCANTIGSLREIADQIKFPYDPKWNTRTFGEKLSEVAKSAVNGEYIICKEASGSIIVYKKCANTIGSLREIADQIKFPYDPEWNTRTFGEKLSEVAKSAVIGDYIICKEASGSIIVYKKCANTIGSLREIADQIKFPYDPKWNTRTFGEKLSEVAKSAVNGEYIICKEASGSIKVYKKCANAIGSLREIAEQIKFPYDPDWNTQTFGEKLIDFINK